MDIKKVIYNLIPVAFIFLAGCACEEDEFGEVVRIEIPVDVGAERNIYQVGDTLWVKADFPKEVTVVGHQNRMELIDYKFFSSLYISEISEEQFRLYSTGSVLTEIGTVELNQLGGYDYTFEETEDRYRVSFGVVLSVAGTFRALSFTDSDARIGFLHPAHYTCGDNYRTNFFIDRINRFSTMENFEQHSEWNGLRLEGSGISYGAYRRSGYFTFRVVE